MERGANGYYHILYKTTNVINGHFYIGIHSTRILEDGYLGSGKRIKGEIKKYGTENFKREIIEYFNDRISLSNKERTIVTKELRNDVLCLNLADGGEAFVGVHSALTPEQRTKIGLSGPFANADKYDETWKNLVKIKRSEGMRKGHADGRMYRISKEASVKGCLIAKSETSNEKRKEKFKEIGHQQGEKNSSYGTCWIYHELIGSRKCKKELLPEYLEQGWIKGRRIRR